jgi:RNA-directed DNA polymerase
MTPRPKNVTAVLRKVRDTLRVSQHLPMQVALASVNPIVRGWVNYFRVGNSSRAFGKARDQVERKVRRFAAKKSKRTRCGWNGFIVRPFLLSSTLANGMANQTSASSGMARAGMAGTHMMSVSTHEHRFGTRVRA